jgi:predicted AlkP superfamily phosphohydrolase/phosphomutase
MMRTPMKNKVLVIGLDGADWRVIDPLIEEGRLPHIASLIAQGSSGILRSTILPHSPVAWTSFSTGKNPGKHGIFYFDAPVENTYATQILNSTFIRTKTIWEVLSGYGKKVGVVDVPITYPPREVNGYMVSGMLIPSEESIFTFPAYLHTELIREFGEFPFEDCITTPFYNGNFLFALKELYRFTDHRHNVAQYLMKKMDWDFFTVVFRGTDLLQHAAWRYRMEEYRNAYPKETEKRREVLSQFYEKIDDIIGEMVNAAGDAHIVIVSDHGFGPLRKNFFVNRWLIKEGFMKLKPFISLRSRTVYKRSLTLDTFMRRLGFQNEYIPRRLANWKITIPMVRRRPYHDLVDWSKTLAYATWRGGDEIIKVNLKGREPLGCIEMGEEYEKVRDRIIERLYALRDPDTGQQVIQKVYKKEEIYNGPFVKDAPDLFYETRDWSYHPLADLHGDEILVTSEKAFPALHHPEGILIMNGKCIKKENRIHGASILDIAPTIFYLMGLPIPDDNDGKVLLSGITQDYLLNNPIIYQKDEVLTLDEKKESSFTQEEQKRIEEHLKSLGYMD